MCLTAFAIAQHPRFPFVLLANRDEAHDRPAVPMAWWPAQATAPAPVPVLAGRDLSAGGTWLGLTAAGRLAWLTNVREPGQLLPVSPSRGTLVPLCLQSPQALDEAALQGLAVPPRNGFNLLVAELAQPAAPVRWASNRPQPQCQAVGPGIHGVSNAALDTPWPKLVQLKQRLTSLLAGLPAGSGALEALQAAAFSALADPQPAADAQLPATGLSLLRERQLSPAFIRIVGDDPAQAVYGTRCSTLVVVAQEGGQRRVHVAERSFGADGQVSGERRYDWALPAA